MKKYALIVSLILTCATYAKIKTKALAISLVFPIVDGWAHKSIDTYAPAAVNQISEGSLRKKISMNYRPFKRALIEFKMKKFDCFVGGDEQTMLDFAGTKTISSTLIRYTTLRAYTLKDSKKVSNLEELKGKSIVYVRGLDLASLDFDFKDVKKLNVTEVNQAVRIMKHKRVDVFLHWFPSTKKIMSEFNNDRATILYSIKERVNCHINERSKAFIKQFNKKTALFKQKNGLKKLHKKFHGVLPFEH